MNTPPRIRAGTGDSRRFWGERLLAESQASRLSCVRDEAGHPAVVWVRRGARDAQRDADFIDAGERLKKGSPRLWPRPTVLASLQDGSLAWICEPMGAETVQLSGLATLSVREAVGLAAVTAGLL